ncbi:MAG: methyltransferase domain-containing protein [bacterium]
MGADLSENLLSHNPLKDKVRCDAGALCFPGGSFDVAFESNLLHHVQSPEAVVREMARVSRRHLVLIEPNALNPLMFAFVALTPTERGALRFTPRSMRRLLESCGVEPMAVFATGMITQELTPALLLPILGLFDFAFPLGEYVVAIGVKPGAR